MPLLFSYGSLRLESVQLATFGRRLDGRADAIVGFDLQPPVPGLRVHANVVGVPDPAHRVAGFAFDVTDAELASADVYEQRDGYRRVTARLVSDRDCWVYVDARTAPG